MALEDDTEVVVAESEGIVEVVAMEDMEGVEIQEEVEDLETEVAEGG